MAHNIFPNYGLQWIKSGQFNALSNREKYNVFFRNNKKIVTKHDAVVEEEEDPTPSKKKKN